MNRALQRGREQPVYRQLAGALRAEIEEGRFDDGKPMPTEAQLVAEHGVSRHTVSQAFRELVADGLVYRVPGRGTFVTRLSKRGKYLRSIGTLEEMMSWTGTEMKVLDPVAIVGDPEAASRLGLSTPEVAKLTVLRFYKGSPLFVSHIRLPPEVGRRMREEGLPPEGPGTVIGAAERFIPLPIAGVSVDITAVLAPESTASLMDCEPGEPILCVERLFYDSEERPVEFAVSHYNPRQNSYRMEMRHRTTH
ncbi:GntR family transcriptional regulator [Rubrobacter marinus]|uniref:GntR family transcriptional regulator n=1 Tax=Rubrobacter marinus TaxID=2653852 RepID=A0A6G8Q0P6_9ACTN|nr:GntR family transcriptional regulator [Rubrobacter marinus]QIN80036.1 GntR family transcriptional regulator [Rubrobacter marinus]